MMNQRVAVLVCAVLSVVTASTDPARADCDAAPPNLAGFSFSSAAIDTTLADRTVTCNMTVTDDLAGVANATCTFVSPTFQQRQSCTAVAPSAGTPTGGTYSCSITFPRYSQSGIWTAQVALSDAVGNTQNFFPQFLLFPYQIAVTSDQDVLAPALTTLAFTPAVNVSAAAQIVTCTMTVTDAKAGVETAFCGFQAPNSNQSQGCAAITPSTGTRNSGTFSCMLTLPRYSDAGNWTPSVLLFDRVGNVAIPAAAGTLAVTASPEDVTAPSLTGFSFAPTAVNVGAAAAMVACTMNVSDALAGVSSASCTFSYTDPFNPLLVQSQSCVAVAPSAGTRNSGTFQCSVMIPRYSAGGLWDTDVELMDLVGNSNPIVRAEQLDVDCGGGAAAETTCRFTNHTTLEWDPVAGATRYNVYRGNISGMTDTNLDQLPDGGYGTCQNARDGNLTDTVFVDADVPTTGQIGFHYLVSFTAGGVEQGLGESSFGIPRTVTPCP